MIAPKPRRHALYAKIQIAVNELRLDDATFRALMDTRFGVRSRKDLSDNQLVELVDYFKAQGFKPKKPQGVGTRKMAAGREQSKMRALWLSLWHLGEIPDASEEALAGFARRVTGGGDVGLEALQWVHGDDAFAVIEALKDRLTRAGVRWQPVKDGRNRITSDNPRHRVIEAQRRLLRSLGDMPAFTSAYLLSDAAADELIATQGDRIRRAKGMGGQ